MIHATSRGMQLIKIIQFRNCVATLVEPGVHSIKTQVAKCLLKWFSVENDSQVFNGSACCDIHCHAKRSN